MKKMHSYIDMLLEANKNMNLTGAETFEELENRHVKDSLALLNFIDITRDDRVLDMGSGAGFPGIPLAIESEGEFVLVDSLKKRIHFLSEVCRVLKLDNVELSDARAELFLRIPKFRQSFDLAVSRAVAPLNLLLEYTVPGLKVGGKFYAYKSSKIEEELEEAENALKVLKSEVKNIFEYTVKDSDESRIDLKIIEIEKLGETEERYPRRVGIPAKRPL